ncbi:MAG: MBL fold metallo-hydrolase [Planctomycetaceae bacterium]|nr:MBL fold metallo-hydrolase [Planctomycetaceae bacterium]
MQAISLQSGSNGNCIYVEAGGVRLLLDAGISGRQAQRRLACHDRDIAEVNAVLISHDHADHCRNLGIFQRKFGLPVHLTAKTFQAAQRYRLGKLDDVRNFTAGETLRFGSVAVETIPTPHDGADGVAFVVDDGRCRLGVLTDLGHVFSGLDAVLDSLTAVFLESNYDPDMLRNGPYPEFLQRRITGPGGHLSNQEAAELLAAHAGRRMRWACLAHLSEKNNTPALALKTHRRHVDQRLPIHVASRYKAFVAPEL